ncbi:MAG: ferredoxin III, nif-specific [Candidatus Competibacteraceae bacterium]
MDAENVVTGITRGGTRWIPQYATELDEEKCIGCGRCYKVCPRDVLTIVQRAMDDSADFDDDDDDDFDDDEDDSDNSCMTLSNPMDCIGCEAHSQSAPSVSPTRPRSPWRLDYPTQLTRCPALAAQFSLRPLGLRPVRPVALERMANDLLSVDLAHDGVTAPQRAAD